MQPVRVVSVAKKVQIEGSAAASRISHMSMHLIEFFVKHIRTLYRSNTRILSSLRALSWRDRTWCHHWRRLVAKPDPHDPRPLRLQVQEACLTATAWDTAACTQQWLHPPTTPAPLPNPATATTAAAFASPLPPNTRKFTAHSLHGNLLVAASMPARRCVLKRMTFTQFANHPAVYPGMDQAPLFLCTTSPVDFALQTSLAHPAATASVPLTSEAASC